MTKENWSPFVRARVEEIFEQEVSEPGLSKGDHEDLYGKVTDPEVRRLYWAYTLSLHKGQAAAKKHGYNSPEWDEKHIESLELGMALQEELKLLCTAEPPGGRTLIVRRGWDIVVVSDRPLGEVPVQN